MLPFKSDRQILYIWFVVTKNVIGKCKDWLHFRLRHRCIWSLSFFRDEAQKLLGNWCPIFRYRAVVSHLEVECKMKSPFLDMKLHTSEEAAPIALISLTGVLVNVVAC